MKTFVSIGGLALCILSVSAQSIISPNIPNGDSGGPGVFLFTSDQVASARVQEVHGASDFTNVSNLPLLITEFSLAPRRQGTTPIDVTVPNVEIRFSTTARNVDSLSPVFAENVGSNERIVFSGPLHLADTGTERFGLHIRLQQPFLFDPNAGNLLLDIRNFQAIAPSGATYVLEAHNVFGDSVSGVGSSDRGVNSPTGLFGTAGFVTRFTVIPEPATSALLFIGIAAFLLFVRKRVVRATNHGQTT